MTNVAKLMRWRGIPLGVTSAWGEAELLLGEVGGGGPGVLITAGVHGDEGPWGGWAIRKLLERLDADDLQGFIRVVPLANPLAMQADKRNAPVDQLDLNRAFPGDAAGSYTERIAHILAGEALEGIDAVIDLHGGGSWCVNAFVFEMAGGEALSRCFAAPFMMKAPDRAVSLTGYARSLGATVVAVEMGGRSQFEALWADRIADGLLRALCLGGVVDSERAPAPPEPPLPVVDSLVLRPSRGGIFVPTAPPEQIGTTVAGGALLGQMLHPATYDLLEEFRAPYERTSLLLLRPYMAQLEAGAMTYVLAQPAAN